MGRHVEGVLGVGGDRGIRARRIEAARSELGIVVGVDQVVGRDSMLRMLFFPNGSTKRGKTIRYWICNRPSR